jgi:hypothetical protein
MLEGFCWSDLKLNVNLIRRSGVGKDVIDDEGLTIHDYSPMRV